MPAATPAATPTGESSTTMQSAGLDPHLSGGMQEQIGRRLAVRHVAAENRFGSKKRIRSVVSRLTRMRSSDDDDATHFGPRSQDSA